MQVKKQIYKRVSLINIYKEFLVYRKVGLYKYFFELKVQSLIGYVHKY